jgi:hypothetical protein
MRGLIRGWHFQREQWWQDFQQSLHVRRITTPFDYQAGWACRECGSTPVALRRCRECFGHVCRNCEVVHALEHWGFCTELDWNPWQELVGG